MNKHEPIIEIIRGCYIERDKEHYEECLRKSIDVIDNLLTQAESTEKELELYKEFVNEFKFEIVKENNSNDIENWEEEYLSMGGATDKAIELFKILSKVGEDK